MRLLYLAVAPPKIAYGIDIWYLPPHKPVGATRNVGSVGMLRALQKVQRMATLAITDSLRTTPTDILDAHAGTLPMECALSKACHRATVRMLTLPVAHPLHKMIRQAKCTSPGKHLSPIDSLLTRFKLRELRMEVITPVMKSAGQIPCFKTSIPASREQFIEEEDQDKSDFKVFSDSSGQEGGAGAAAVIYRKGRSQPLGHLKVYLGLLASHNTYEGEVVGGLLGCYLIQNIPGTNFKTVSLYIDNQAIIKASVRPKASSGQYLVQALTNMANNLSAQMSWLRKQLLVEPAAVLTSHYYSGKSYPRAHQPSSKSTLKNSRGAGIAYGWTPLGGKGLS